MLMTALILLPALASFLLLLHPRRIAPSYIAGATALLSLGILLWYWPQPKHVYRLDWLPSLDLNLLFQLDGLSWLFALIIALMGLLVVLYAHFYMNPQDPIARFFAYFLLFMAAMQGVVIAGNIIQIVIFWELTSLSSFLLIAYWHHRPEARKGAKIALTITATGGFFLLAAMLLIGHVVGSYDLDIVLLSGDRLRQHILYPVIVLCFAVGVLSKSAQFPFHFWLPNAMAAPTPVSAFLHSATLVKAGIFLIMRFWPVLAYSDLWFWLIGGAGLLSLLLGAYFALFQRDLKAILAYSTISHLGLIVLLLGMNSPFALAVALLHVLNHAAFKAALFMSTGIIDHETGTRDIQQLHGLATRLPATAVLTILAAAAMSGVPFFNGFVSKELFFEATLAQGQSWLPWVVLLASAFSVAYTLRLLRPFWGKVPSHMQAHDPPKLMLLSPYVLLLVCIVLGWQPQWATPLITPAITALVGNPSPLPTLHAFHGWNTAFAITLGAFALGGLCFAWTLWPRFHSWRRRWARRHWQGRNIFDATLHQLDRFALFCSRYLYSPRLQVQLFSIVLVSFCVAALPLLNYTEWLRFTRTPFSISFALLWLTGGFCALAAAYQAKRNRFRSILLAGGAGLATVATFAWLSAPDLALTQLLIEIVTLVLLLLGLRWLPRPSQRRASRQERLRSLPHMLLAMAVGLGMAALSYVITTRDTRSTIGQFFTENALPLGGGTNVVNVILVDFRAFDTFGEITVLGVVALGVFALLRRFRPPQESLHALEKHRHPTTHSDLVPLHAHEGLPQGTLLVPNVLARLLMPIISLIAFYFFFRGHQLPGGGFIAGIIFALGVLIQYLISGIHWVELRSRIRPHYWLAFGLLAALLAALLPLAYGLPLLTALTGDIHLPILGAIHLSSVILFDLGVFTLVVGASTYMLVALAHQSVRAQQSQQGGTSWK